jgi:hypothetical protein
VSREERPERAVRVAYAAAFALGLVVLGLSAYVVVARFRYPIDAEWMVGSVRDTVERARDGRPIYVEPSDGFIPFIYPPLYFWIAGLVARVTSVFVACKAVSLVATAVLGYGVVAIARTFGAPRRWQVLALALHVACYPFTLYFFDLERVDATAAAVVMAGVLAILASESVAATLVGGALLGLSLFAKQLEVACLGAVALGLLAGGRRRRAAMLVAAGAVVVLALHVWLHVTTHGWFDWYCVTLPGRHGIDSKLVSTFFIVDVPKAFALALASLAVIVDAARSARASRSGGASGPDDGRWRELVFGAVLAATLAATFFMRAHRGGWLNVDILWTPFACAAVAVAAARAEARAKGTSVAALVSVLLASGVAFQLLAMVFDPTEIAPDDAELRARRRVADLVTRLERDGEVIVTTTGNLTEPRHFHAAALYDVLRADEPMPRAYEAGLAARKYAALVVGAPDEFDCPHETCKHTAEVTQRYYFVAARLEERDRRGTTGFDARPRWILRPRKHPLDGFARDALRRRQLLEMGIAEMRRRALAPDVESTPDDGIEELAAQER